MASADHRSRSRKIRDISRDMDDRSHSIASSTGSNHGTVTMDLTNSGFQSGFSELDPNDDEIFSSTNKFQYTPAAKVPELRDTAKKYGRWSPRREPEPVINTSIMDQAFKDFSGNAAGNNTNTFTLELPRGNTRNRFQASPTPVGDDLSFLQRSFRKTADEDKENAPRQKSSAVKSTKTPYTPKESPYISHASRNSNGERRTLAELQAQVHDGSENSLLLPERPVTVTLQSTTSGRFTQPQSNTSAPISRELPPFQASLNQNIYAQAQRKKTSAPAQDQGRYFPAPTAPVQKEQSLFSNAPLAVPKQRRQPAAPVAPVPEQARRVSITPSVAPVHLSTTFAPGHSQVYKTSPTELLLHARRRSQPDSSFLFTPTHAPVRVESTNAESRVRANSNPTMPTQTFVIPAECAEKTKPFDPRLPVRVQNGKVEAPPDRHRRKMIDGIPIPDDEEELYRMIIDLHNKNAKLETDNEAWSMKYQKLQQQYAVEVDGLRVEVTQLNAKVQMQEMQLQLQQKTVSQNDARYENDTRASSRGRYSRASSRASGRAHFESGNEDHQFEDTENFTQNTNAQSEMARASSRGSTRHIDNTQASATNTHQTAQYVDAPSKRNTRTGIPEQTQNFTSAYLIDDIEASKNFSRNVTNERGQQVSNEYSQHFTERPGRGSNAYSSNATKDRSTRGAEEYSLNAKKEQHLRSADEYALHATKERSARGADEHAQHGIKEQLQQATNDTKQHPVLSSNARQVLDGLCDHNCNNCMICVRMASFHEPAGAKRSKQTVRTEKPIAVSKRGLPVDEDHTVRPARTPGIALAVVIKGLQDEIEHLRNRHTKVVELYHRADTSTRRKERMLICEEMDMLQNMIDVKSDQVYNLYDVVEGQEAVGQAMDVSAVDVTIISAHGEEEDDTLPWEQVLDED